MAYCGDFIRNERGNPIPLGLGLKREKKKERGLQPMKECDIIVAGEADKASADCGSDGVGASTLAANQVGRKSESAKIVRHEAEMPSAASQEYSPIAHDPLKFVGESHGLQPREYVKQDRISEEEVKSLLSQIQSGMRKNSLPESMINGTTIRIIHPEYWEISLLVPYKVDPIIKVSVVHRTIDNILFDECHVNPDGCDYFGKQSSKGAYEWYFRHPNIPEAINDRIEAEIEEELGHEIGLGIPIPSGTISKTDTAFLTLKDDFFRAIESGQKTTEYRNFNQYYCDKFFATGIKKKFIKLNRGYLAGDANRMIFELAGIVLVSEDGREIAAVDSNGKHITSFKQLPKGFIPISYGIKLGKRIA